MNTLFVFSLCLFIIGAASLCALATHTVAHNADHRFVVIATTGMIADAVATIGAEHVHVEALMGPGIDPHLYRAKESDVHRISQADCVIYNGLHLEGRMASILEAIGGIALAHVLVTDEILTSDFDDVFDPHVWHSVPLWRKMVVRICEVLAQCDPAHAKKYADNAAAYDVQLEALHRYILESVQKISEKQRILVTAHDAFGYFGKTYGFHVVGLQGMSTDAQISVQDVRQLVDYIVENKISAMFLESSIPERNVRAVQDAVAAHGWHIAIGPELYSDALGDQTSPAGTYIGMMKSNIDSLVQALS
jgi:manganese/zinc/iron transport system substrate-binding protein